MTPDPLVRIDYLDGPISALRERGIPVEPLLRRAELPVSGIGDPGLRVTARAAYRFIALAARDEGLPEFGLVAARKFNPLDLDWTRAALTANTRLGDSMLSLVRTSARESDSMRLWIEPCAEGCWLSYRGSLPIEAAGADCVEQFMLQLFVQIIRSGIGARWMPGAIRLQARCASTIAGSEDFAEARVETGAAATALLLPTALLWESVPGGDRRLHPDDEGVALVHRLREHILESIGTGHAWPDLHAAAATTGAGVRTLQRRLGQVGMSYFELVDRLRRDLAADLVKDPQRRLLDVAVETGYSDSAHFTRAFQRWFGVSPTQYRRQR